MSDDSSVVLFWWSTSGHEVFPWTPQLRDEDRLIDDAGHRDLVNKRKTQNSFN